MEVLSALLARRGAILLIDWELNKDVTLHHATSEITEITVTDPSIVPKTEQKEFSAELTLAGYHCDASTPVSSSASGLRVKLQQATDGVLFLQKNK